MSHESLILELENPQEYPTKRRTQESMCAGRGMASTPPSQPLGRPLTSKQKNSQRRLCMSGRTIKMSASTPARCNQLDCHLRAPTILWNLLARPYIHRLEVRFRVPSRWALIEVRVLPLPPTSKIRWMFGWVSIGIGGLVHPQSGLLCGAALPGCIFFDKKT